MNQRLLRRLSATSFFFVVVTGCGLSGGDGGSPPPISPSPTLSAQQAQQLVSDYSELQAKWKSGSDICPRAAQSPTAMKCSPGIVGIKSAAQTFRADIPPQMIQANAKFMELDAQLASLISKATTLVQALQTKGDAALPEAASFFASGPGGALDDFKRIQQVLVAMKLPNGPTSSDLQG